MGKFSKTESRATEILEIELLGKEIKAGQSIRLPCLFCDINPQYHSKCAQITKSKEGTLYYKCYRDCCQKKLTIYSSGGVYEKDSGADDSYGTDTSTSDTDNGSGVRLPSSVRTDLQVRYNLSLLETSYLRYDQFDNAVVMPCYDFDGSYRGSVTRYKGKRIKSFPWAYAVDLRHSSHIYDAYKPPLYICEDYMSMLRIGRFFPCMALMGTQFKVNREIITKIKLWYDEVAILLDYDAIHTAAMMKAKLQLYFREVHLLVGKKDPKDCSDEELKEVLFR